MDGIPNLLSTQMHVFAEDVLIRLGNEYKEFVQKKTGVQVEDDNGKYNKRKII